MGLRIRVLGFRNLGIQGLRLRDPWYVYIGRPRDASKAC